MTATKRLEHLLTGQPVDRPPFMPAIYDLKPAFLQAPAHTFGQNKKDIVDALVYEAGQLEAEALTAAYDVYNIEAEAVGCTVLRDPKILMPEIDRPLFRSPDDFIKLEAPGATCGRMEVFVQAASEMLQRYGGTIPVRGGISGPFSMAGKIYPEGNLLMETVTDPEKLRPLLRFCTDTIKTYAKAFARTGAGVVVFDSLVTPPILSPQSYHELILPYHREIMQDLEDLGIMQRTLIIGGNTLPLLQDMVSAGATQYLLDYNIPLEEVKSVLQEYPYIPFRVNLPPSAFGLHCHDELKRILRKTLESLKDFPNLIIGTGILPPDVPPAHILSAKKQIQDFYN